MSGGGDRLQSEFIRYASFGAGQAGAAELDSAKFLKMARDSGLVDKKLSPTDLDLIFTKVKAPGAKRLDYSAFRDGLREVAARRGSTFDAVAGKIVSAGGPTIGGTIPDAVKFHDDKNLYTGVHTAGGPSTNDNVITLDNLADRSGADARGVKKALDPVSQRKASLLERRESFGSKGNGAPVRRPSETAPARRASAEPKRPSVTAARPAAAGGGSAEARAADVFVAFASSAVKASTEIDSARFLKLCTDAGLLDSRFNRTQCDLVFTRAATAKRMGWAAFRGAAVAFIAEIKGVSEEAVLGAVASVENVSSTGTVPDAVRFHDDKNTYTGTHAAGGPTTIDGIITLDNLADRSGADVRGVKTEFQTTPSAMPAMMGGLSLQDGPRRASGVAAPAPRRASGAAMPPRRDSFGQGSGSRRTSATGATIAGSANKPGGVYDRLADVSTYTGVYKKRFEGGPQGGRINDDTINYGPNGFSGHTNSGGDHIVRDISQICRR